MPLDKVCILWTKTQSDLFSNHDFESNGKNSKTIAESITVKIKKEQNSGYQNIQKMVRFSSF